MTLRRPYPSELGDGGASTIREFAGTRPRRGRGRGRVPELVFVQSMKGDRLAGSTAATCRGGPVQLAGIGAAKAAAGADSPRRTGIRSLCSAPARLRDPSVSADSLAYPVVDPRFSYVRKGAAPVVEYLGYPGEPDHYRLAAARGTWLRLQVHAERVLCGAHISNTRLGPCAAQRVVKPGLCVGSGV